MTEQIGKRITALILTLGIIWTVTVMLEWWMNRSTDLEYWRGREEGIMLMRDSLEDCRKWKAISDEVRNDQARELRRKIYVLP